MIAIYDYAAFCAGVQRLHGRGCWLAPVLAQRGRMVPERWLRCAGPMDGHHLVPKAVIKRELGYDRERHVRVAVARHLEDPRCGAPICRFHHDMLEAARIALDRAELPAVVEEFAAEHGLVWWLERSYGPLAVSA